MVLHSGASLMSSWFENEISKLRIFEMRAQQFSSYKVQLS